MLCEISREVGAAAPLVFNDRLRLVDANIIFFQ